MNTRGEIIAGVKAGLQMIDTSTFRSDTTITEEVWNAYLWVAGRHPWPKTEKAKYTSTTTNYYYDQPSEFKADSVFLIVIADQDYEPTDYEDYLRFKRENPNNTTNDHIFAMFADQLFIFPIVAASLEMVVWGLIQVDPFVNDDSITIFSNSEESVNEAIMHKAISALSSDPTVKNNELLLAQKIADDEFEAIKKRRPRFHRKNATMFKEMGDLFPQGNSRSPIANFNRRPA